MKKISKNIDIKLDCERITVEEAIKIAKDAIVEHGVINIDNQIATIYIVCKEVSDLIIFEEKKLRKCTDKEWGYYFRNILNSKIYRTIENCIGFERIELLTQEEFKNRYGVVEIKPLDEFFNHNHNGKNTNNSK